MSRTTQEAVNDILDILTSAVSSLDFPVIYPDLPLTEPQFEMIDGEPVITPWFRVTVRHNKRKQRTFGSSGDTRFYDSMGMVFIEVYTPTGNGLSQAYELCDLIREAYEGVSTPNGVWFRDVDIQEAGLEGMWSHVNVLVQFEYDTRK